MIDALEGYAIKNGKSEHDPSRYPTKEEREDLHRRIKERERARDHTG